MRKYWVLVSLPNVYHTVDAESEVEAAHKAVEKFQKLYNTRQLKPIVLQIKSFDHDE
jgi:hypothetical protein